jgi:L-malate glycosyltransferase
MRPEPGCGARVVVLQGRLTEYRVPLFERMRGRLAGLGIGLEVAHGPADRASALRRDGGTLPWARPISPRDLGFAGPGADLLVVPHELGFAPLYPALVGRAAGRVGRLALWGHGANFQARRRNGLRARARARVARLADWWFAYTSRSVEALRAAGVDGARVTCVDNAIDVARLREWQDSIDGDERRAGLDAIGLQGGNAAVFIGSLDRSKALPFLFEAADLVRAVVPDFELIVVGDGPLRAQVRRLVAARPWARWVGARHGRDKVKTAVLGKLLLNPGMIGLSILDGFALGLPVVTTDHEGHSPEIAYLEPGRNGVMTRADAGEYAAAVAGLLRDDTRRGELAAQGLGDASRYTIENMSERFCDGIAAALGVRA